MPSEKIRVQVDRDLEDLIPEYLESIRQNINKIKGFLESGNFDGIRILGHNMKGSGGGYGFNMITEVGLSIENASKQKDKSIILNNLKHLEGYLDNVTIEFVDVD